MGLEEVTRSPSEEAFCTPLSTGPSNPNDLDYDKIPSPRKVYSWKKRLFRPIDRYLRREDTYLAQLCSAITPFHGREYLDTNVHKHRLVFNWVVGLPAAFLVTPIIMAALVTKRTEDWKSPTYIQWRVAPSQEGAIPILKIRSMAVDAEFDQDGQQAAQGKPGWEDPRSTDIGSVLRRYNIDELPQIYQVLLNQLCLTGIRSATFNDFLYLQAVWSYKRYINFVVDYSLAGNGITGVRQTLSRNNKNNFIRYHPDHFFTQNADLGLELYLLWRTLGSTLGIL